MKCDELKAYNVVVTDECADYICGQQQLSFEAYAAEDVDAAIAELKAKLYEAEEARIEAGADAADYYQENRKLKRALWMARAERYRMREFIAREEVNLSNQMSWSRFLRERTYDKWVRQLLRIANLANELQNKCRAKAEEYK